MGNTNKDLKLPKAIDYIIYMVACTVVGYNRHVGNILKFSYIGILVILAIAYLVKIKMGISIEIHQGTKIYTI